MRSAPLRQAYKVAEEIEKTLRADKHFEYCCQILHDEGTTMFIRNVYVRKWNEWYMVFPEHHEVLIYHEEDAQIALFKREAIKNYYA